MGDQAGNGGVDEKPAHEVCVEDFYLGTYEVTEGQWRAVMGSLPRRSPRGDTFPTERISWQDAQEFIRRLNLLSGMDYRLPTEAEWEYAARSGGKTELYPGVNDLRNLPDFAWFQDNCAKGPRPVGTRQPNGLGIHDMAGNVWEWVRDRYDPLYYRQSPRQNPQGDPFGINRVLRGGGCTAEATKLRASYRDYVAPDLRTDGFGMRVALPAR